MAKFLAIYDNVAREVAEKLLQDHGYDHNVIFDYVSGKDLICSIIYMDPAIYTEHSIERTLVELHVIFTKAGIYCLPSEIDTGVSNPVKVYLTPDGTLSLLKRKNVDYFHISGEETQKSKLGRYPHLVTNNGLMIRFLDIHILGEHNAVRSVRRYLQHKIKSGRACLYESDINEMKTRAAGKVDVIAVTTYGIVLDLLKAKPVKQIPDVHWRIDYVAERVAGYEIVFTDTECSELPELSRLSALAITNKALEDNWLQ